MEFFECIICCVGVKNACGVVLKSGFYLICSLPSFLLSECMYIRMCMSRES